MRQNGCRPLRSVRRIIEKSSYGAKVGLVVIDKVALAAVVISYFQGRLQLSQARLERARRISELSVDKPVSIVGELPAHLDAFILYADHIRSANLKNISAEHLTELWAAIRSDIDSSYAYCSEDRDLKSLGDRIKNIIAMVRAEAMDQHSLRYEDLKDLEQARSLVYKFQQRVINLSVDKELELFDKDYEAKSISRRLTKGPEINWP
jgi:hypothetical protein